MGEVLSNGAFEIWDARKRSPSNAPPRNFSKETLDLALGRRALAAYERTASTQSLAADQVRTLILLRYLALLEGDLDRAWLFGRQGAALMADSPHAVHGETSAAFVSVLLGDGGGASVQLRRAWELLRSYQWSTATNDEWVALTDFAMIAPRRCRRKHVKQRRSIVP